MTDQFTLSPDVVLMPVPIAHAIRVAAFVASLGGVEAATVDGEDTVYVTNQGAWTRQELQLLHDQTAYAGVITLLDLCAESGSWVAKSEIEEVAGVSAIQLRNELGAFSKLTKRLFGDVRWPMEWKKQRGVFYYRLDPVVATWWRDMQEVPA